MRPLRSCPVVDAQGRVFLHMADRLVALRPKDDGIELCWQYVTGSHCPGAMVLAADETLRLHCSDGTLHAVNVEGKQVFAPVSVSEPLGYAAPTVDTEGNTYISAFDGGLLKVDADGRLAPSGLYFRTRQKLDAPGLIHDGVLYVGSDEGCMFAIRLEPRKGRNLWDHAAGQGLTGWYIHSAPALTADEQLVVAGHDETLYGFRLDGQLAWKTPVEGQMLGSPVIDPAGQIYVGVSQSVRGKKPSGVLLCFDGNSHKLRWQYQATGPIESTPVLGDDQVLYVGDNEGIVHAVDLQGQARWTAQVGAAVRSAGTLPAAGQVAFGLDDETLVALKCSSQKLPDAGWPKYGRTLAQNGAIG